MDRIIRLICQLVRPFTIQRHTGFTSSGIQRCCPLPLHPLQSISIGVINLLLHLPVHVLRSRASDRHGRVPDVLGRFCSQLNTSDATSDHIRDHLISDVLSGFALDNPPTNTGINLLEQSPRNRRFVLATDVEQLLHRLVVHLAVQCQFNALGHTTTRRIHTDRLRPEIGSA